MNTLMHADIFFFISTIATIALTLLLIVILFYVARTARAVSHMIERVKRESTHVLDDLSDLREKIKDSGNHVSGLGKWFASFLFGKAVGGAFKSGKPHHPKGPHTRKGPGAHPKDDSEDDME